MPSTRSPGAVDCVPGHDALGAVEGALGPPVRRRQRRTDSGFSAVAEAGEVEVAAVNTDAAVLSASTAAAIVRRKILSRSRLGDGCPALWHDRRQGPDSS